MKWRVQVSRDIVNMVQDILETQRDSTKVFGGKFAQRKLCQSYPIYTIKVCSNFTTHILAFKKIGWVSISSKSIKVL